MNSHIKIQMNREFINEYYINRYIMYFMIVLQTKFIVLLVGKY